MTKRFGFKMKMIPGFKEEYRKRHSEIWPELVKLLKDEGIGNYSIFLDEETNYIICISGTVRTGLITGSWDHRSSQEMVEVHG